ncbi:hypothetical protein KPL44_22380 [Clostridium sp. DSM 17811]|nr:hypothetical protein [Clostridium sp. DSM 17811]
MVSFLRVILGFTITFVVAFPLAVFLGNKPKAMPYINPSLVFMRHIPPIAMIPILILWLGIGESSKLVVIFLATFFPFFSNTLNGVTNYDKKLLEVGEIFHFSKKDLFLKIIDAEQLSRPDIVIVGILSIGILGYVIDYYKEGIYHIQHINTFHSKLKKWKYGFQSVSTKYLANYMYWFKWLQSFSTQKDTVKSKFLLVQSHTSHTDTKLKDFKIRESIYI